MSLKGNTEVFSALNLMPELAAACDAPANGYEEGLTLPTRRGETEPTFRANAKFHIDAQFSQPVSMREALRPSLGKIEDAEHKNFETTIASPFGNNCTYSWNGVDCNFECDNCFPFARTPCESARLVISASF